MPAKALETDSSIAINSRVVVERTRPATRTSIPNRKLLSLLIYDFSLNCYINRRKREKIKKFENGIPNRFLNLEESMNSTRPVVNPEKENFGPEEDGRKVKC